jgi:hypothetical protein
MPATAVTPILRLGALLHSIVEIRHTTMLGGIVIALFEMAIFLG